MTKRAKRALRMTAALLGAYVVGYFACSDCSAPTKSDGPFGIKPAGPSICIRDFPHRFLKIAYSPLGWIEAKLRRDLVVIESADTPGQAYFFDP